MSYYRAVYIVVLSVAIILSQSYAGHLSGVFLLSVIVLPLLSLLMLLISFFSLKISIDPAAEQYEKHSSFHIKIAARNRSIFPIAPAKITATLPAAAGGEQDAELFFALTPLKSTTLNLGCRLKYRGLYYFKLDCVYMYDFLKLFCLRKNVGQQKEIVVLPRLFIPHASPALEPSDGDDVSKFNAAAKDGVPAFIRKYNEGDDVRRIHWKLSAKQDDYLVWQQAKSTLSNVLILCDLRAYTDDPEQRAEQSDAVIESALALAACNIYNDCGNVICSSSGQLKCSVRDQQSMLAAVNGFAVEQSSPDYPDFYDFALDLISLREDGMNVALITPCPDGRLLKLAATLCAECSVSLLLTGKPSEDLQRISELENVTVTYIDAQNPADGIEKAIANK